MTILNVIFAWLVDAGYLAGNPLSLTRRRGVATRPAVARYLTHEWWSVVKTTIETLLVGTERERLHTARCRWLFTVLYLAGLCAAEIASTTIGGVFCRRDAAGVERWWTKCMARANRTRLVPATDEPIAELARYRCAHGLAPSPYQGENRTLLLPLIGALGPAYSRLTHDRSAARPAFRM